MEHNWDITGKFWSIAQKHNRQFKKHNRRRPSQVVFLAVTIPDL